MIALYVRAALALVRLVDRLRGLPACRVCGCTQNGACYPEACSWAEPGLCSRCADDAEMWCDRCGQRHDVVWFAPSDIWNAVMRDGERGNPDEFGFCCPSCFMQLADERGVGNRMWKIQPERILEDGDAA